MKPVYLSMDTLDDRKEIIGLLNHLSPADRVAWLEFQCKKAAKPYLGLAPKPSQETLRLAEMARWDDKASERLTIEVYLDTIHLSTQYDHDLLAAAKGLERVVKVRGRQ